MSVFEFVFWLRSAFAISVLPMQCWVICTNLIRCHVITTHPPALPKDLLLNSKTTTDLWPHHLVQNVLFNLSVVCLFWLLVPPSENISCPEGKEQKWPNVVFRAKYVEYHSLGSFGLIV